MSDKMYKQKRSSVISLGRKVLSVAVASTLLLAAGAQATGLGRLTVLSALGQPLNAEIELTAPNKDEIDSLLPKLASVEAFRQANIELSPSLQSLRFTIVARGNGYVIKVASSQAMNEPFVDMLLEMTSSNGKVLREYTFVLDPAELRNSQSPQISNPALVAQKAASTSTPLAVRAAPVAPAAIAAQAAEVAAEMAAKKKPPAASKPVGEYTVKSGDTLGKLAANYKPEGVSLDQMLVSLYRSNPQAFAGKNMNRLKVGQILALPDADAIRAADGRAARAVVLAHASDFNAYRQKLADSVSRAPASKELAATKQSATGSITSQVKESAAPGADSPDKLKLSKAAPTAAANAGNGKSAVDEDKIAKDRAAVDAANRVKELEKNVGNLQHLLDLKNQDLASKEAEISAKQAQAKVDAKAVAASATATAASAAAVTAPAVATLPAVASAVAAASEPAAASVAAASKPRRKIVAPPPPPPQVSIWDEWSDWLMPGGAVLLAVLAGAGVWLNNRKKKLQQFEDSILTGSSMKANSMFGSTGGQSVDTNNSVFNSNFAPSASQLDANEVDPVAEADVYIAYGRDSQAEEILKEALRTQPDRHAVRVKLLEIYFARKDAKLFERLASELYGMTSGEGEEWAQAASMGIVLEPGNPLYVGGKAKTELNYGAALGSSTQPLEDLDPEALLGNSLSRDMLDAISVIDTASHEEVAVDNGLDFDLGMGFGEAEVPTIPEPVVRKEEVTPEVLPEVDFGTIDFDFSDAPTAPPLPAVAAAALEEPEFGLADSLSAELPEILQENAPEPAPVDLASPFEFDLSGIDLDLDTPLAVAPEPEVAAVEAPENAEMSTKLDLAVAYHEIGDKEGARELLDEVLKGGSSSQKERANGMLAQMS